LHWFYEFRSWHQEGATLFAQAIARLRTISSAATPAAHSYALGRLLGHHGYLLTRLGAVEQARAILAESAQRLADGQDAAGLARTLSYQGQAMYFLGDYAAARHVLDQSLPVAAVGDPDFALPVALTWASVVAHALNDYGEAERLFRTALANWRRVASPRGTLWCVTYCSATLMALGKYAELEPLLRESLHLGQATGDRGGVAMALHQLGVVALRQQQSEEAIALLSDSLALRRTIGTLEIVQTLNDLAAAHWLAGARAEAGKTYREAFASALTMDCLPEALEALTGLAEHLAHQGRHAGAMGLVARVLADSVTRSETRHRAEQIRIAALSELAAEQVATIEAQARVTPLSALVIA
jgi:tetratricopeptide (TPR) repeat protein